VSISGVGQDVSELLQAVYTKTEYICCGFAAVFNLNIGFPNLKGMGTPAGWAKVSDGASVTSYRSHYKALRCLL